MPKHLVTVPGHTLEIATSLWTGFERIRCDGQIVSPHSFSLEEGYERVTYEVDILTAWFRFDHGYIVRRNGIILAHSP
jgi:hypothetical protein